MNRIKEFLRNIKYKRQRANRGYDDTDVWSIDYWFLDHIIPMLKQLRVEKCGTPVYYFPEVERFPKKWLEEEIENLKRFKKLQGLDEEVDLSKGSKYDDKNPNPDRYWMILSRMIWCFEQAHPDNEPKNEYWEMIWNKYFVGESKEEKVPEELNKKFLSQSKKNARYQERCLNEGLNLFKEYFHALWD